MIKEVKIVSIFLLFILSFFKISAQLCQGSLGDPVVNITFGSGANPGAPLNGLTNYNYVTSGCPSDGNYSIGNSLSNCFGSTWHNIAEDHTAGDISGYIMIVNASSTPGDFFLTTVDGLCPNTTYEFASWILNVIKQTACGGTAIKPNITFTIETTSGTILKSYTTGDIPATNSPEWKQYGFFFLTPAGINSIVLRMTNNAPGGCGNDLLLDDITFRACGPLVNTGINGSLDSVSVCSGDNSVFTLQANVSAGYNDPVYQWQVSVNNGAQWTNINGANNTTFVRPPVSTPGTYRYRLVVTERTNSNISSCSIVSDLVVITVNDLPVISLNNKGHCSGDTLFLTATGGVQYSWTGPMNFTGNTQSPFIAAAVPGNSGMYYVKVTSANGCINVDSTLAKINLKPIVYAGADTEVCEATSIQLNSTGNYINTYQWSPANVLSDPGIPNPVAFPKQNTLYILTVANNDCSSSDSVMIVVNKNPTANAGPDKILIQGQSVTLYGTATGTAVTYAWTPREFITGSGTLTPTVSPPNNKTYTLQVISNKGCGVATDSMLVKIFTELFIPNAFSPNNDGLNDTWNIETLAIYPKAEVKVFNRFGELIFDNQGKAGFWWDGNFKSIPVPVGTYAYIIDLKNNSEVLKGVVFVIR